MALSADGRHAYLAGSSTVTVMERDRRTGALTRRSCLAGRAVTGCAALPPGMTELGAPAFSPDQRTAYLVSSPYSDARGESTALLVALTRDTGSGALSARAREACLASAPLRACAVDARLDETISAPVFAPGGRDAYVASGPVSYDVPLDSDVPFALASLRHDPPTGSLSAAGAFCLSRLDRAGCVRDRRVSRLFELAISPDGTRVYATRGPDIATFARDPRTGALQLIGLLRGCPGFGRCRAEAPIDNPTEIVAAPGGRHVFVASNDDYGTGTVVALATP
jgi:hypothetical protein